MDNLFLPTSFEAPFRNRAVESFAAGKEVRERRELAEAVLFTYMQRVASAEQLVESMGLTHAFINSLQPPAGEQFSNVTASRVIHITKTLRESSNFRTAYAELNSYRDVAAELFGKQTSEVLIHDIKNAASVITANLDFISSYDSEAMCALPADQTGMMVVDPLRDIASAWARLASAVCDNIGGRLQRDAYSADVRSEMKSFRLSDSIYPIATAVEGRAKVFSDAYKPNKKDLPNSSPRVIIDSSILDPNNWTTESNVAAATNLASNIISNACVAWRRKVLDNGQKETVPGIDARLVSVSIFRQGSELVFRCADQGIGMSQEQLTQNSPKFILRQGVTGAHGTGLGLKDLQYYNSGQVWISVLSRPRDVEAENATFFCNHPSQAIELESSMRELMGRENFNTIFEIRLNIKERNAATATSKVAAAA